MGRETRRVPKEWNHPEGECGGYIPLNNGTFSKSASDWDEGNTKWTEGLRDNFNGGWKPKNEDEQGMTFEEWEGVRPDPEDYMPEWPEDQCTHIMMYETCTDGTPISPAFESPEELARWLADNGASSFGSSTATYEQWLGTCKSGWSPSAIIDSSGLRSGVEAMASSQKELKNNQN